MKLVIILYKDKFFSSLTGKGISDEDFIRVQQVMSEFNLENPGDLHDLYVKTDVLLSTDVFDNFRELSMSFLELDPCHFMSLPSLVWNGLLNF